MKDFRNQAKKIGGVLLLAGMLAFVLGACSPKVGLVPDADKYHAGDAEIKEPVEAMKIEWAAGNVDLVTGSGDAVILKEEYSGKLSDEKKMHWYLDGTTLKIRYDMSLLGAGLKTKKLTVTIPEQLVLKDLDIDVASAELNGNHIAAENADIDTASGNVSMSFASPMMKAGFDTASGEIMLEFAEAVNSLDIDTASGNVLANLQKDIGDLKVSSASGSVTADLAGITGGMDIDTASGDVSLGLPENADLTLLFDTSSGSFDSEIPFEIEGDKYISGTGKADISIDTASGDLKIRKIN